MSYETDRLGLYKWNARSRGRKFTISDEFAIRLFNSACDYCGLKVEGRLNGIDRVDNKRGYEPGNVVPCCAFCNRVKGVSNVKSFRAWLAQIQQPVPPMARLKIAGRPRVYKDCPFCDRQFTAREFRSHTPKCKRKNGARKSA